MIDDAGILAAKFGGAPYMTAILSAADYMCLPALLDKKLDESNDRVIQEIERVLDLEAHSLHFLFFAVSSSSFNQVQNKETQIISLVSNTYEITFCCNIVCSTLIAQPKDNSTT
jgi:hypothetical protein